MKTQKTWGVAYNEYGFALLVAPDGRQIALREYFNCDEQADAPDNDELVERIVQALNNPVAGQIVDLTDEQLHALEFYAEYHGKDWKEQLASDWSTGRDAKFTCYGHLLRQIRNNLGPEWLANWELPK